MYTHYNAFKLDIHPGGYFFTYCPGTLSYLWSHCNSPETPMPWDNILLSYQSVVETWLSCRLADW